MTDRVRAGSLEELEGGPYLTTKVGSRPVCVFLDGTAPRAVDDRCPHMGFPLHRGTVKDGLVTCHWHNARFDLISGGTLDPWADDVTAYPVEVVDGDVYVLAPEEQSPVPRLRARLEVGLERNLTLITAKSTLGLLSAGVPPTAILEAGVRFGVAHRDAGWGSGLTVLTAMANVLPVLDPADRALALVHGLAFVARDTIGHPSRFALGPLDGSVPRPRLAEWYRMFIENRSAEAAERALVSAIAEGTGAEELSAVMGAAVTDHVFIDEGHVLDFTNKAFECLEHLGFSHAPEVLPTLVAATAAAHRHEEDGAWRHPHDLVGLLEARRSVQPPAGPGLSDDELDEVSWAILGDDPSAVVARIDRAVDDGASLEQLGRAVAYAAALRIVRFHTQNDHADWNAVHHAFTTANALHQMLVRSSAPELLRGVYQCALRVYLDRFLNVPAARLPRFGPEWRPVEGPPSPGGGLEEALTACFDEQGQIDRAVDVSYRYLSQGGDPARLVAALGHGLLREDAQFHWFQVFEAAVRQSSAWPDGSPQQALVLCALARFLAAHTPTRRELPQVVGLAARLERGESLHDEDPPEED